MSGRVEAPASCPRLKRPRPERVRTLIQVLAFSAIIIPCGPIAWFAICVIRTGGVDAFLHSVAAWEEFSYKWPAAFMLSTIIAIAVSLKIAFAEKGSDAASPARPGHGYWTVTLILVPGLIIAGATYAVEAISGLWLGVVLGFFFVCHLIALWVISGQSKRQQ